MYGPFYSPAEERLRLLYDRLVERQDSALQLRAVQLGVAMAKRLHLKPEIARQERRKQNQREYARRLHYKAMAALEHHNPAAYVAMLIDLKEVQESLTIPAPRPGVWVPAPPPDEIFRVSQTHGLQFPQRHV